MESFESAQTGIRSEYLHAHESNQDTLSRHVDSLISVDMSSSNANLSLMRRMHHSTWQATYNCDNEFTKTHASRAPE